MALTAAQSKSMYQFFALAFNAAPGVTYLNQLDAAINSGMSVTQVVEQFTAKAEFTSTYPATLSNADFATQFITANVGSNASAAATAAAIADITAALNAGWSRGKTITQVFTNITAFTEADATWGTVVKLVNNKVAYAQYYTETLLGGSEVAPNLATLRAVIANVTPTTSAVVADIAAAFNPKLTTGVDALTGTALADVFAAVTSSQASLATLQATDSIDGSNGDDTLKIDLNSAFTGFTSGTVKNVEAVELTNKSAASLEFDATGITGANKYVLNSTNAAVTLKDLATGVKTIEITGQKGTAAAASTFKAALASDAAEISGTADSISLNLNNVGVKTASATTTLAVSVDVASFENINVGSGGTANVISFAAGTAPKTVVATGAGSLDITAVQNGLTSFDASAVTGAVTANLKGVTTASSITSVKGGTGKDSFTVEAADLLATAVISGGGGADTLVLEAAGGTVEYNMSGVPTLTLVNTGTLNFSGGKTTGLTTVGTTSTTTGAVNFLSMGAADLTFNASGVTDNGGLIKSDHTGASTVSYTALTATVTAASASIAPLADYEFAKSAGALTVNVGPFVATTQSTITAAKAASVSLTVSSGKDTAGTTEFSEFNSTLTAAEAKSLSVTATGKLGTSAVIDAAKATTATVVNGTTAGGLSLVTPKLNSLTVTTGSALLLNQGTENLTELETLNVTATAGKVTFDALAKVASVTLAGAGSTSEVTFGNLGANTNAQNLSIAAAGLKGGDGLKVGDLIVGKGYDVTVAANAMAGKVVLGAIAATSNEAKNVSVAASGGKGTFSVGAVTATGVVNIDASNTTSTAVVDAVSGSSVTVNVSGSAANSTVGTITAKDSATLTLNALNTNTNEIKAASGSTALNVALQGGILADAITITGVSTQTAVTVTGDLGGSDDSLTLNAAASTVAQNINISGLVNYDAATIRGGSAADTIFGGSGNDNIRGNAGADVITGGTGDNTFTINSGHSTLAAMDTITDLKKTDIVIYEGANTAVGAINAGSSTVATIAPTVAGGLTSTGIATFGLTSAAGKDTLAEVVGLVDASLATVGHTAFFTFDGTAYLFINDDTAGISDTVVKLTGLNLDAMVLNFAGSTGITGFGA